MNILCIGDVVAAGGCEVLKARLPKLKREFCADLCIVNAENSAVGNGILPSSADAILNAGADLLTGGNHSLKRPEIYDYIDRSKLIIRPYNLVDAPAGRGYALIDMGRCKVAVINLMGRLYMEGASDPFAALDNLVEKAKEDGAAVTVVDFHAEATSEKRALGFYADSKVSVFFGTHTHIQTADIQVLPQGTGYITDLGMCGGKHSVLGVEKERSIARFLGDTAVKFKEAPPPYQICGAVFEVDEKSGKCLFAKSFVREVDLQLK